MAWKCPNCDDCIDNLDYTVDTQGTEYGTAYIRVESRRETPENIEAPEISDYNSSQSNDGDWSGDVTYECPLCNFELSLSDLIWVSDEEILDEEPTNITKPTTEPEECNHVLISPENSLRRNTFKPKKPDGTILCKACRHMYICDDGRYPQELYTTCPKCGEENSTVEFNELLKTGFFNSN